MNKYYLLLLSGLTAFSVNAGERETFDFDWNFKYYGSGMPAEMPSAASSDSSEGSNPASAAIDGRPETRWCAKDGKAGHWLEVDMGKIVPIPAMIREIEILWENDSNQSFALEIQFKNGKTQRKNFEKRGNKTIIKTPKNLSNKIRFIIKSSDGGNWASIREITFKDAKGKLIKPLPQSMKQSPKAALANYDTKGYKKVQLPHDWAISSPFLVDEPNETGKLPWNGYGWYRKNFEVAADFSVEKDRYYLDFDGVMACPQIYVNGKKAGEWAYGYASFRVDITPYLKAGDNLIAVQASNKLRSTRWYPGAGIYRHVWLEKTGPVHLAQWGVYVTTPKITKDKATIAVETTVDNTSDKQITVTVQQEIAGVKSAPMELTLAPKSSKAIQQSIILTNPERWDIKSPKLYEVATTVSENGKEIDSKKTSFGIRTIEWKPEGFFLNGRKVRLNGVCEHHDLGPLGAAFYTRGMERKLEILQGMGCNSIRTAHNPPAPEVLALCDKMGILVIDELFDIWQRQKYDKTNGYHVFWPQWWKKDVSNFLRRDRNHPSIIAWSTGNEITEITTPEGPAVSTALSEEMKKYDKTRPVTAGVNHPSAAWNAFGDTLDVFGFNYKPGLYKKFKQTRPNRAFYSAETSSCVGTRDTYFFPLSWNKGQGFRDFQVSAYGLYSPGWANCPDVEFKALDATPDNAGEYVWTGFDYIGEPTPYNQDASNIGNFHGATAEEKQAAMEKLKKMGNKAPSRSSYFGIIDLAGIPKDTYYLYMSRWAADKKQAHILPHWNWSGREGKVTPVMVFSSGDEAELFLNGKSQGVRKRGEGESFSQSGVSVKKNDYRFVWEEVVYKAGELKVIVKKDGKAWATASRSTTGATASVKVKADRSTIIGDSRDLSYISLDLIDAQGRIVPTDSRNVEFSISGPAELIGFCNGDPTDHNSMQALKQRFFNGRMVAVLRGKRGESGQAIIRIKANDLPVTSVTVKVSKASEEQLRN